MTANCTTLVATKQAVETNSSVLRDTLLSFLRFEEMFQTFLDTMNFRPSGGLYAPGAPLKLLDAIGRDFDVPMYLANSHQVRIPTPTR